MNEAELPALFEQIAAQLTKPAGDAAEFATLEGIVANRPAFVVKCHQTWKKWHNKAIEEILVWDGFALAEKKRPIGPVAVEFADYNRAVWRRVNDAIIWTMMGMQRHLVKRLCLYRPRGPLNESNPKSVLSVLEDLNANPLKMAVWNDATSCVDIGDLTIVQSAIEGPAAQFVELKEGRVNKAILDMIHSGGPDPYSQVSAFAKVHGDTGMAQLARVLRQGERNDQALTLMKNEKGFDPVSGTHIKVVDVDIETDDYDEALNSLLHAAFVGGREVTQVIDGCLWLYANADKGCSRNEAKQRFLTILLEHFPALAAPRSNDRLRWDKDRIVCLNECFSPPIAKPFFLRNIKPENSAAVVYGDLLFKVFLYLDWDAFGSLVTQEGGEFRWSSLKEARRARTMKPAVQPTIARGFIPQVRLGGVVLPVMDANLVELLFDGVTPRVIVKRIIASERHVRSADNEA